MISLKFVFWVNCSKILNFIWLRCKKRLLAAPCYGGLGSDAGEINIWHNREPVEHPLRLIKNVSLNNTQVIIQWNVYCIIILEVYNEECDSNWSTHSTNITYSFFHWGLVNILTRVRFQYKPRNILRGSENPFKCEFDTHGSVHRRLLSRNTNKMQLCNRIYYSKVYWRLSMSRATHRSSSGALNCICSFWFICPCGNRPLPRLSGKWSISHSALTTAGHHLGI